MLLGIDLIRPVDAHRADNLQRRRLGRRTRSLEEFCAHELGVTLDGGQYEEEDQLTFPELSEVLGPPPARGSLLPAPRARATA